MKKQNWYQVLTQYGNLADGIDYITASNMIEAQEKLKALNLKGQYTLKRLYNEALYDIIKANLIDKVNNQGKYISSSVKIAFYGRYTIEQIVGDNESIYRIFRDSEKIDEIRN